MGRRTEKLIFVKCSCLRVRRGHSENMDDFVSWDDLPLFLKVFHQKRSGIFRNFHSIFEK